MAVVAGVCHRELGTQYVTRSPQALSLPSPPCLVDTLRRTLGVAANWTLHVPQSSFILWSALEIVCTGVKPVSCFEEGRCIQVGEARGNHENVLRQKGWIKEYFNVLHNKELDNSCRPLTVVSRTRNYTELYGEITTKLTTRRPRRWENNSRMKQMLAPLLRIQQVAE